ncbi:hypothetical protein JCM10212_007095 [Sporobolomyces blumeae]
MCQAISQLAFSSPAPAFRPFCLPSSPCWPSRAAWQALNTTLDGRLVRPDAVACLTHECSDPTWRVEQPASLMYLNFETGQGLDAQRTSQSVQGARDEASYRTPAFVVDARETRHVVEAVNFARKHRLKLRIKNTGHDYLGRSSGEGAFTIWTHHLNSTRYVQDFVPYGAPLEVARERAIVAGSGVTVYGMNEAADRAGVIVPSGVSKTVGAAGGYVLGGGHGPLAPLLGLAADNVLEFTVVLANGSVVKASPYSNPSLFTALRGGGASSFGVVVETVFRAFEPPKGFVGIFGTFAVRENVTSEAAAQSWTKLMKGWVDLQPRLSDAGPFAGYAYVRRPQPAPFAYILPSDDLDLATSLFDPFMTKYAQDANLVIEYRYHKTETWFELWNGTFTDALHSLDEVGINLFLGARFVPRRVVEEKPHELADFLANLKSPSIVHLVAGGKVAQEPTFPSTVHPAWRTTLLHVDLPVAFPSATPPHALTSLVSYLATITNQLSSIATCLGDPAASYASESNYFEGEDAWRDVWYGRENYARLEREKDAWDPDRVFGGRRTVGSVGGDDD